MKRLSTSKLCLLGMPVVLLISLATCQAPPRSGDIRLSGNCRGNLEIFNFNQYTKYNCDRNFGSREAQVACREVGCDPVGARRVSASLGYAIFYISEGYSCSGFESSLSQCRTVAANCNVGNQISSGDASTFVGIVCGEYPPPPTHEPVPPFNTLNQTTSADQGSHSGSSSTPHTIGIVLGIYIPVTILLIVVIVAAIIYRRRKRAQLYHHLEESMSNATPQSMDNPVYDDPPPQYSQIAMFEGQTEPAPSTETAVQPVVEAN